MFLLIFANRNDRPLMIDNSEATKLPAYSIAEEVNRRLRECNRLIITAPPGAGKSTLLPLTILEGLKDNGKVIMLEPRRLAARQIAERMASLLNEKVGETVGYRIRFEKNVSSKTRIEVVTEGILTRMLLADPNDPAIRQEFLRWVHITVKGKKQISQGLQNRRNAEANLYFKTEIS